MKGTKKGWYTPRNPEKYVGNVKRIRFLSSWEEEFCRFCDNNPNILHWASEEIKIPYIKPTDGRVHTYYPDFWIQKKTQDGKVVQEIIEVKPFDQTIRPKIRGKRRSTQLFEAVRWSVNQAKWKACQDFCNKYGITFRLVTEKHMFR